MIYFCFHFQVRFVAGDDMWLSPETTANASFSKRPFCAITLTIYAKEDIAEKYFNACYKATAHLNIRYHWGKHFPADTNSDDIEKMYPRFNDFAEVRKSMDPKGVFLNPFLKKTFGFDDE